MTLSVADFSEFHQAVHGQSPFSWQTRLLEQIVRDRKWPKTLDLPTGAGKTTCIDIALFALALDAQRPKEERWCPRRIAMVVDRRIVVDQVRDRGHRLASALRTSADSKVKEVAALLSSLTASEDAPKASRDEDLGPLGVFTLRGGMPKDDGWARTPNQPLIISSTVDQIGSRMLVQGYGVSQSMRPVHAGLLANDLLLLLDEVHLSQPFQQLLHQLEQLREGFYLVKHRFQAAALSATPGKVDDDTFRLLEGEKAPDSPLGPRLHVSKRASFREAESRQELEKDCVREATRLIENHRAVAVVVNRVGSAMTIAKALAESLKDTCDVVPLTGRMRPLDRDEVLDTILPRIKTGRAEETNQKPLIVVGTQCIEAGADFDFNAMVTECASIDALRQRFGRVDRLGKYEKSEGVIVYEKSGKKDDPIYGASLANTAAYLKKQAKRLDFGSLALPMPDDLDGCLAPKKNAPVLLPAYLDLWMQSSPPPASVPDVSLWLHGDTSGSADVQVIWRDGFEDEDLRKATQPEGLQRLVAWIEAVRPTGLESISLPVYIVRKWLQGIRLEDFGDAEGSDAPEYGDHGDRGLALRWDGDTSKVVPAKFIRPGDTVIIPCLRGGLRDGCFDESAKFPVTDVAEQASFFARGVPSLRLDGRLSKQLGLRDGLEDPDEIRAEIAAATERDDLPRWQQLWLSTLAQAKLLTIVGAGEAIRRVLRGRRVKPAQIIRLRDQHLAEAGVETTTDDEDSPFIGRAVHLSEHSRDVEARAREYADSLGLPAKLVQDIALAGWLHDIGKADERFQILLRAGDEIAFYKDPTPLAKSEIEPEDKSARDRARARSGYPRGARHEALSLAMIERHEAVRKLADDAELVFYLVSSHHGHCRPFLPVSQDDSSLEVALKGHQSDAFGSLNFGPIPVRHDLHRLDNGLADRFWALVGKYGWFELCWLEAILRLADHRASEEEQEREEDRR